MIVTSTNKVCNLEDDLMPFLQKERTPNFPIDENFDWCVDANTKIEEIIEENIKGPLELLEKYKQYEYILNVDKKALLKELFNGDEKAALNDIREKIQHYKQAYDEIMNLSNDIVDFPLFRVMAQNMKNNLGHQAEKIKEKLLEGVYKYCQKSVEHINKTYEDMNKQIMTDPTNERELVATREFIKDAPNKVE